MCAPECAGAHPAPDVVDQPVIVLCAMWPPVLPLTLSASTSGALGVPDSNIEVVRMAHQCCRPIANGCVVGSKLTIGLILGETLWGAAVAVIVVGGPAFGSIQE